MNVMRQNVSGVKAPSCLLWHVRRDLLWSFTETAGPRLGGRGEQVEALERKFLLVLTLQAICFNCSTGTPAERQVLKKRAGSFVVNILSCGCQ